jgi:glycosyltransferase involved in cell wall biosynthesis
MRILFIAPKIPWPATDGGRIAIYELIRHMTMRGHQAALLGFGSPQSADELRAHAGLNWAKAVPHDTSTRPVAAAMNLFSPLPYTAAKYKSGEMSAAIHTALQEELFDLVQLENTHMGHYLRLVQKFKKPSVLRLHNVESLLAARYARTAPPPLNWYVALQARRMTRFESWACEQASMCLAITEEDAARARLLAPDAHVAVSPAGVDLQRYAPQAMSEEPRTVVFVGALDWPPNVDGIRWFRAKIWSRIVQAEPTARWIIVGKTPPADILHWPEENRNIQVTGYVDDVRPYLHAAAVVIVPLRSGGGMRLKILEAMAAGKAVVSTPMGAEGIPARDGEEIILAEADRSFGVEVIRLLREDADRKRIAKAARRLAELFGWQRIAEDLETEYSALLEAQRPG